MLPARSLTRRYLDWGVIWVRGGAITHTLKAVSVTLWVFLKSFLATSCDISSVVRLVNRFSMVSLCFEHKHKRGAHNRRTILAAKLAMPVWKQYRVIGWHNVVTRFSPGFYHFRCRRMEVRARRFNSFEVKRARIWTWNVYSSCLHRQKANEHFYL